MIPPELPGHEFLGCLRDAGPLRQVWRTRLHGRDCVTRILLTERVHPNHANLVERVVVTGRGSIEGLPESVALTLGGYRVAASHPASRDRARWPRALAAGLTSTHHVWITTTWMDGVPLHELDPTRRGARRVEIVRDVLVALVELHAGMVAHGDLKLENVVVPDEGPAVLIDLDTMREVGDPRVPAVTRDLTRPWAAPEQRRQQQTFLASDLWAFAKLARALFPEGLPPTWAAAVAACQAPEPLARPRTELLLHALFPDGEATDPADILPDIPLYDWLDRPVEVPRVAPVEPSGSEATQRVPEGGGDATERVPEVGGDATVRVAEPAGPTPPPIPPRPEPTSPRAGRRGMGGVTIFALVVGVVVAVPVLLGAVALLVRAVQSADERVAELERALKDYKTRPELNGSRSARDNLAALGAHQSFQYEPPRWDALAALARVWSNQWQNSGYRWGDADTEAARALVAELGGNHEPEAALARSIALFSLCRHGDPGQAATASTCHDALAELGGLYDRIPASEQWHWLRVEVAFAETVQRSWALGKDEQAGMPLDPSATQAAVSLCDRAGPWLPWGPVNGKEVLQECLSIAGYAQDVVRYRTWAQALFALDGAHPRKSTMEHVYRDWSAACEGVKVKGSSPRWGFDGDPWCVALGHYARGCFEASWLVISGAAGSSPDRPWDTLSAALQPLPIGTACVQ